MDEFLNRITAQRKVIKIVNKETSLKFQLVGLSDDSLERWRQENKIDANSEILTTLYLISSRLFFLANKSQEQITKEYRLVSKNVSALIKHLQDNIQTLL